jgi:demethylmenaquinone methyltransferase/2-methoxy-6-polyprenyl-1,4-benzoquinol methylase
MPPADEKSLRNSASAEPSPKRDHSGSQVSIPQSATRNPQFFDSRVIFRPIVPVYDLLNRVLSLGRDQVWRRRAAGRISGGRVLDLACGTGDLAEAVARRPGVRVVGCDILPEMLAVARKKRIESAGRVLPLAAAAGERISFRTAVFDAITIAFGIRNFVDRGAGLREMHRVLRPGGLALILEFAVPENTLFRSLYLFYFLKVLPTIGRLVSRDSRSYSYLPESVLKFPQPSAFADEIRAAGFRDVMIESYTLGIVRLYHATRG